MFRFVHAADLHLDSPFRELVDAAPHVAEVLRRATFDAYEAIIDLCIEREAGALLVAGDVFDGADRSLKAQLRFVDGLKRLSEAGIRAFICHGNHDPLDGWQATVAFPEGVHRFGAEVESVPVDPDNPSSPEVCGVSYPTQEVLESLLPGFPAADPGRYTIGLMHANVGAIAGHGPYAPCSLEEISATGYDYWALGHVHTRSILRDQAPAVVYPGNPQGRHANERGERGVYVVEVADDRSTSLEFIPVDAVRWERIEVAIDDLEEDGELVAALERTVDGAFEAADGRDLVYRLSLMGRGALHASLIRAGYVEDLRGTLNQRWENRRPFAYCGRIDDGTASTVNRDEYLKGQDLIGDLLRLVDEARDDETKLEELREELAPLYQYDRARRYLGDELPTLEKMRELLADAEGLVIEGLLESDGR